MKNVFESSNPNYNMLIYMVDFVQENYIVWLIDRIYKTNDNEHYRLIRYSLITAQVKPIGQLDPYAIERLCGGGCRSICTIDFA